jgi:hypothetical protein
VHAAIAYVAAELIFKHMLIVVFGDGVHNVIHLRSAHCRHKSFEGVHERVCGM